MEINVEYDWIGWIGTVAIVAGYYLIDAPPQIAISTFVIGMNVFGYRQWSLDENS